MTQPVFPKEKSGPLGPPLFTDRIKDIVLEGMQQFFHHKTDQFHWESDQKETEVMIIDKFALNLDSVENTPIAAVNRGSLTPMNRTLDQLKSTNIATGGRRHMDLFTCPITVGCYSTEGLEAEHLANYVFGLFLMFRHVFRKKGFHEILTPSIGEEAIVKSDSDIDVSLVPVSFVTYITETWILTPYAPKLEQILDPVG